MVEIVFCFIALSACFFAFLAVSSHDVFHCAVWLALTLLCVAVVYFYLDAEFLGVIQILVYVGGIITLFIFAINLTISIGDARIRQTNRQVVASMIVSVVLFYFLIMVIVSCPWAKLEPGAAVFSLNELGRSLMTTYVLPFEFISLLLLSVLVGAIVIGRVKK